MLMTVKNNYARYLWATRTIGTIPQFSSQKVSGTWIWEYSPEDLCHYNNGNIFTSIEPKQLEIVDAIAEHDHIFVLLNKNDTTWYMFSKDDIDVIDGPADKVRKKYQQKAMNEMKNE